MHVLVTGSSGQIGTNLALRLQSEGHEVFGVDRRPNPWTRDVPTLLQDLSGRMPGTPGGVGGVEYPAVDLVVHLAAHAKVHELVLDPGRALENMTMTFNVLEFCRGTGTPLIFSSTREVYGDVHRFVTDEANADFAFTESPYSASKIAGEALIYSYARCYALPYIVLRFSNVYGRFDSDLARMTRVIPLFIDHVLDDEPLTVYGGEEKTLDFTYVDDCVDGILAAIAALSARRVTNETINLAYGEGNTLVRCAKLIGEAVGREPRIELAPALVGEVTRYVANIERARRLLGWSPQVPLASGIPRAVEWFLEDRRTRAERSIAHDDGPAARVHSAR